MKLATTTVDFSAYANSQLDAMEFIACAGFNYIDYDFGRDYLKKDGIYSDFEKHIERVKRKAEELGVKLVQAHSPMGKPLEDEDGKFAEDTAKCIKACGEWGIENIVIHSGYVTGLTKEETIERNKAFYEKLLPVAEDCGVNILTENFNKMHIDNLYWIDNAPDLLELIKAVDHPLFHTVWDTGHANMQEMPQDEALRMLKGHVYGLHVQDNMGDYDSHVPPFFGTMSLDSLMNGLAEIGYNGYFTFEAPNMFLPARKRKPYEKDARLLEPSLGLKIECEKLLYEIGKHILSSYGLYER